MKLTSYYSEGMYLSRIIWFDGWCNSSVFDESTGIGHIGCTSMSYAHFFSFVWRFLFLIGHMQELLFLYTHKIVPIRDGFYLRICYMPKTRKNSSCF